MYYGNSCSGKSALLSDRPQNEHLNLKHLRMEKSRVISYICRVWITKYQHQYINCDRGGL